jgi:hypothetical protein
VTSLESLQLHRVLDGFHQGHRAHLPYQTFTPLYMALVLYRIISVADP